MRESLLNQEILIFTDSRFFSKEFNEEKGVVNFSKSELIADACWNGLIDETLPEIASSLSLFQINEAGYFLDLVYGDSASQLENVFSLNPYLFLLEGEKVN